MKNPSSVKIARGDYNGNSWWMWRDGDQFVVQMRVKLGKIGGDTLMAECDLTFEGALQKIEARADAAVANYAKRWPNDVING